MYKTIKLINVDGGFIFDGKDYPMEFLAFVNEVLKHTMGDDIVETMELSCMIDNEAIPCTFILYHNGPTIIAVTNPFDNYDKTPLEFPWFNVDEDIDWSIGAYFHFSRYIFHGDYNE